jgi:hypothetical protein
MFLSILKKNIFLVSLSPMNFCNLFLLIASLSFTRKNTREDNLSTDAEDFILFSSPLVCKNGKPIYFNSCTDETRGLLRNVVYLCWPKHPRKTSPNAGEGVFAGSQPMSTVVHITWHGAQINFGDLLPYLTYGWVKTFLHSTKTCVLPRRSRPRLSRLLRSDESQVKSSLWLEDRADPMRPARSPQQVKKYIIEL